MAEATIGVSGAGDEADYAEGVLRALVGSGVVRAVLKTKCADCRATMQLDPDDMANTVLCDFCGQEVRFAPMIGWGSPKWVFRLAGHLSNAQVSRGSKSKAHRYVRGPAGVAARADLDSPSRRLTVGPFREGHMKMTRYRSKTHTALRAGAER